jgi:hypothetical protein
MDSLNINKCSQNMLHSDLEYVSQNILHSDLGYISQNIPHSGWECFSRNILYSYQDLFLWPNEYWSRNVNDRYCHGLFRKSLFMKRKLKEIKEMRNEELHKVLVIL